MPVPPTMPASKNSTLRTERTHEENQERAYIAASHRTDRSLEARMESARRASEIHKQRTGRPLKITEEGVLSGEVYMDDEEELPAPYYQLDQHLRNDAADFRKRLVDYLTVNVDLRRALSSAIEESNSASASANAAVTQPRGSTSMSSGFQEGQVQEQGIAQPSSFSPTVFAPPYQGPTSYSSTESSNPPTPSTPTHNRPQATRAQFQTPIPVAYGTQFHMGPVGLGTLPPHYYQGTHFARIQTAPTVRIPQQAAPTPSTTANMPPGPFYSAVLSPEQYQALSQTISARRPSVNTAEMVGSPMSDISMMSFRTAPNPTTPSVSRGSPEPLLMRRMSVPSKIPESPLRTSMFIPNLQRQEEDYSVDSASVNTNVNARRTTKLMTEGVGNPMISAPSAAEGNRSIPQSPAVKRRASTDLNAEEPPTKSARADDSSATTTSYSPAQSRNHQSSFRDSDFGFFDFSLPQNTRDILYGPGMYIPGNPALSFSGASPQDLGGKRVPAAGSRGITPNTTASGETTGTVTSLYNFSDPELDLSSSLMDHDLNHNAPLTFGMNFSKYDNFVPTGNIEDMWREYFAEKGVQTQHANTGDAMGEHNVNPRVS